VNFTGWDRKSQRGDCSPRWLVEPSCLRLAENAVKRGATDRALALGHATTGFRDDYYAFEIALLLALHAVGVAFVGLCHFVLLVPDTDARATGWA